jgi:hypothetical protein
MGQEYNIRCTSAYIQRCKPRGKGSECLYLKLNLAPRHLLTPCIFQHPMFCSILCTFMCCSCLNFYSPPISICPIYTFANYSSHLIEPLIVNHCRISLRANTLLIKEFLTSCLVNTYLYNNISECS